MDTAMTNQVKAQKPRELHMVTTQIGDDLGPIGSFFESAENANEAANLIRRSNNPVVLHLTDYSAYQRAIQALHKYSMHLDTCGTLSDETCNCGLDEALKEFGVGG
ncbi:hypothetical protein D3C87_125440 [compost metagenome]